MLEALTEQAVVVVQAHSVPWQAQSGDGVQKAGGQPPQPAVAQRGLGLHGLDDPQVPAHVCEQLLHLVVEPQGQQAVGQQLAQQELGREVVELPLPPGGGPVLGQPFGQQQQGVVQLLVGALIGRAVKALLGQLKKLFAQLHMSTLLSPPGGGETSRGRPGSAPT